MCGLRPVPPCVALTHARGTGTHWVLYDCGDYQVAALAVRSRRCGCGLPARIAALAWPAYLLDRHLSDHDYGGWHGPTPLKHPAQGRNRSWIGDLQDRWGAFDPSTGPYGRCDWPSPRPICGFENPKRR